MILNLMYSECLSHMNKLLENDISFFSWGSDGAGKNEFESVYVFTGSFLRKLWKMKT